MKKEVKGIPNSGGFLLDLPQSVIEKGVIPGNYLDI